MKNPTAIVIAIATFTISSCVAVKPYPEFNFRPLEGSPSCFMLHDGERMVVGVDDPKVGIRGFGKGDCPKTLVDGSKVFKAQRTVVSADEKSVQLYTGEFPKDGIVTEYRVTIRKKDSSRRLGFYKFNWKKVKG